MNPFLEKPSPVDAGLMDWSTVYARSYDKNEVDPYTKVRIILMNGTEYEAVGSATSSTATARTTTCGASWRWRAG